MSATIVTRKKVVRHMIVRDRTNYFLNSWENNRAVTQAQPITAERAQAIYDAYPTAVTSGHISFAPGAPAWSWTSEQVQEDAQ